MVNIYTLPACVQCESTKRWLSKNGIEYSEIKLQEAREDLERLKSLGFSQAPIVEAGESLWSGFRLDKLQDLAA